jgi:hypothetical protein
MSRALYTQNQFSYFVKSQVPGERRNTANLNTKNVRIYFLVRAIAQLRKTIDE